MPEEKEIKYRDDSGMEVTEKVDAEVLDEKMDDAEKVFGVEGDDKSKAAYLARDEDDKPDEPITGERNA